MPLSAPGNRKPALYAATLAKNGFEILAGSNLLGLVQSSQWISPATKPAAIIIYHPALVRQPGPRCGRAHDTVWRIPF